jgi:DNA-binding NarL/FixJ family response regulator
MRVLETLRSLPDRGWRPLHSQLTTREWEVVELLAEGAGTQDIAAELVLSPATVYGHVKNIMRKLDVSSRDEAVAAAQRLRPAEMGVTA